MSFSSPSSPLSSSALALTDLESKQHQHRNIATASNTSSSNNTHASTGDISSKASSSTSTSTSSLSSQPMGDTENQQFKAQLIERPFVDQKKMVQKLRNLYGTDQSGQNNFKIQLRLNRYTILVPETLTEREINEFCW